MELTPEDRQAIYLEEKTRREGPESSASGVKRSGASRFGKAMFIAAAVILFFVIAGSIQEKSESAKFQAMTPAQRQEETVKNCLKLAEYRQFKTYSELSEYERKLKFSCDAVLAGTHVR